MDVVVEPETADDHAAIREVVGAAFAHHPEVADLPGLIRASPHYVAEFALVARAAGRVVGFVMISGVQLVADDGTTHDALTLSPLAVAPTHQRRGIGVALVRAVLSAADAAGAGLVTLEGDPRYYGPLGFTYAPDSGVSIPMPDSRRAGAQVYRLRNYDPAVRGRLVYPPAFPAVGAGR
jgi:putative acetyltransferase